MYFLILHTQGWNFISLGKSSSNTALLLICFRYNLKLLDNPVYFVSLGGTKDLFPRAERRPPLKTSLSSNSSGLLPCPALFQAAIQEMDCGGHGGALWSGMKRKLLRPFFLTLNLFEFASCTSPHSQTQKINHKKKSSGEVRNEGMPAGVHVPCHAT